MAVELRLRPSHRPGYGRSVSPPPRTPAPADRHDLIAITQCSNAGPRRRKGAIALALIAKLRPFAVVALWSSLASADAALAQSTTRVSVASSEAQSDGSSANPAVSADGRLVAFESSAANLVSGDANGHVDIYVRDRGFGVTRRVSLTDGELEANGPSSDPAVSADGRFVVFASLATNLVGGDTNETEDVFVRDRINGTTRRVSVTDGGLQANGASLTPAISRDGQFVAFVSEATNLIGGDTNGRRDVFVHDLASGTTRRASVSDEELQADATSGAPAISGDGRFVAFASLATNLIGTDANLRFDVYIRDRVDGTTRRVSVTDTEREANRDSFSPAVSDDGRYVAFSSESTNLITTDSNDDADIYIRDRAGGTTRRVSVTDGELQADRGSFAPAISGDGRFVAFHSRAANLIASDSNFARDIFVRDRAGGTTRRVSVTEGDLQSDGASSGPAISADGRFVAFASTAHNLVAGDSNLSEDVFVRDRGGFGLRTRVTLSLAGKRMSAQGPLRIRVRNGNPFPVPVVLSAQTAEPMPIAGRKRRVRLGTKVLRLDGRSRKTVRMTLPRSLREALRRGEDLSLRLTAKVTGPAGRTRIVTKIVSPRVERFGRA